MVVKVFSNAALHLIRLFRPIIYRNSHPFGASLDPTYRRRNGGLRDRAPPTITRPSPVRPSASTKPRISSLAVQVSKYIRQRPASTLLTSGFNFFIGNRRL